MQSHITVGSQRWPDFAIQGVREHYWRMLQALGIYRSLPHTTAVLLPGYSSVRFVAAYDVEKVPQVMASGVNLQAGQDIQIHVRGFGGADQDTTARRAWVCLHMEKIIEINASGVHILE